ncbi:hypothetical protein DFH09DRAFT_1082891 [Mycena vulgaris]|nr:hypothetical protein DFH09DRAFT_1082891 [Mycena vulgaris]
MLRYRARQYGFGYPVYGSTRCVPIPYELSNKVLTVQGRNRFYGPWFRKITGRFHALFAPLKIFCVVPQEATSGDESSDLSVLTATPDHLKGMLFDKPLLDDGSSSLDDFPLPGIEEDVGPGGLPNTMDVDPTVEEPMDVSSDGEEGKLNGAHGRSDWNEDDEFDPKFWNLLASTPEDKVDPGQVRLIIFNYARDSVKAIPYFHPDVFRPEEYGPEGTERWYLDTQDVFKILEEANALPEPPWLCKWSLSGFPWVVGPIAFQLSTESEVQLDLSKRRTEAITVNGPPDALRALLCFLPITDVELKEFTAKMTADIEMVDAKLDDGMLDDLLEIEVKPEIDVKPDIRLTSRSRDQKKIGGNPGEGCCHGSVAGEQVFARAKDPSLS